MLFLISKVHIISIQQIEQFWCLETYKLFVPAEKQLAHPLFSSNSVCLLDAAMSSGILKAKQKLGVTFNSDKLGGIAFTKISKLTMCSA